MDDGLERLAQAGRPRALGRDRVVLPAELHRLVAPEDRPDDLDVLARPGERLAVRDAVPPLDHLGSAHPETQPEPPARQVVERDRRHGRRRRGPCRDLHDRGAEFEPAGPRRHPRQPRSEEHTSELQSHHDLVCRLLLEKKKKKKKIRKKKKKKKKNQQNKNNKKHK